MSDISLDLESAVQQALTSRSPLKIVGGNSKEFYGRETAGTALHTSHHNGITNYEPSELVVTARGGTPLSVIETTLAENNQMLAFEPPYFGGRPTLGGAVASGLSGPRRPFAGAVRDFVLGCKVLNGRAETLSFGGEVMKNVAGYDISRLMTGALGTLGVLLEISLKILPRPVVEKTLFYQMDFHQALEAMNGWCGHPLPLSGLCFDGDRVFARLSGGENAIASARKTMGGEYLPEDKHFWKSVCELQHPFFENCNSLWRLSMAPGTPQPDLPGSWFFDWGGAQRWLKTDADAAEVFRFASQMGGHATLFHSTDSADERFQPQTKKIMELHKKLKQAFDPYNIFNPGRMYSSL